MREDVAQRIVAARAGAPFLSAEDLCLRARLETPVMKRLAGGDALQSRPCRTPATRMNTSFSG
ncbi:hypothetical protein [Roseateles sp. LYH14W]|uniref:DNA polymerase helix-hairpin-helix motif domain-containing protein n=1 Tax=Pelomonas parva TaxID=3299032 RepID=A0ABW7FDJ0_9BURK